MQSKIYPLAIAFYLILINALSYSSHAQCTSRYLDTIFSTVDTFANIPYTTTAGGGNNAELMDIYQPTGDSACLRHLIIWVHGGAFIQGSKNSDYVELWGKRYAQRGYVCASIDYRLAPSIVAMYDSSQIFKYAWYAVSDLKAAIRYFYKDAIQGNYWNIDTNSIFIGGSSAGAIAVDFASTIDSLGQLAPPFQTVVNNNGGLEGNSGNDGYSTKVIGVASLAGAVNNLDWIQHNTPPMILSQGTADNVVPYDCDMAFRLYTQGLYPTIHFCGSQEMAPRLDSMGVIYSLQSFPGSGHVPWDTNTVIMDRMDSAVTAFFYSVKCSQTTGLCTSPVKPTSVPNISAPAISIYPNPANDRIYIHVQDQNELLSTTITDYTGRIIKQQNITGTTTSIPVQGLCAGIYTVRLSLKSNDIIIRKITIE
ncbi:MAG: Carboxylesterase type [Bacteroidetes bacterium]|nr:Carboxylesterase type [Bacteroidota bacterium]